MRCFTYSSAARDSHNPRFRSFGRHVVVFGILMLLSGSAAWGDDACTGPRAPLCALEQIWSFLMPGDGDTEWDRDAPTSMTRGTTPDWDDDPVTPPAPASGSTTTDWDDDPLASQDPTSGG